MFFFINWFEIKKKCHPEKIIVMKRKFDSD